MPKIVCLSDTHNCNEQIIVPDGDVLIHAGDATIHGTQTDFKGLKFYRRFTKNSSFIGIIGFVSKYYFTGKPCKNGHICKRFKSNRWCYECALIKLKEKNERLKEETKKRKSQTPKEKARAKGNYKFDGKICKRCGNSSRYVADARCVNCATLKNKLWQLQNKKKRCFNQRTREAKKLKATPTWADLEAIKKIYLNCPDNYSVDHIVPLQGKNVCGLHVEYNLQYLTSIENSQKSNKFICD